MLKEAGEGDSDSDDEKMKEKEKDKDAAANDINLDCISGTVLDGDVLLHAIPVVAPYSVVSGYSLFKILIVIMLLLLLFDERKIQVPSEGDSRTYKERQGRQGCSRGSLPPT